jgi:hypothetical protein
MENLTRFTVFAFIGLLFCVILAMCQGWRSDNSRNAHNLRVAQDSIRHFENRLGTVTASRGVLILENRQMQQDFIKQDAEMAQLAKEFAKVQSAVKFGTVTTLPGTVTVFTDTVPCEFERKGEVKSEWYKYKYTVTQNALQIDSLQTWTTTTVMTGFKKKWFLGEKTLTVDVTNTNPYIHVTDLKAAQVVVPQRWYEKWYVHFAAGAVVGGLLMK